MRPVRVGVVGPLYPDSFADNVVDTLARMSYDAVPLGSVYPRLGSRVGRWIVDAGRKTSPIDDRVQARFVNTIMAVNPDVVVALEATLAPASVARLRERGVPVAMWFPDGVSLIHQPTLFGPQYDWLFMKDPLVVERARALIDPRVSYMPEACNPRWHRPTGAPLDPHPYVVVVGNVYPSRARLLSRLLAAGIPIRIYGPPPARGTPADVAMCHTGRYVAREEKALVFEQAAAVLNNLHPAEMASVNCRLFEATASGAVVLCESRPALGELFSSEEVLAFGTFDELVDLARAALAGEPTSGLRRRAWQRAHRDHSYGERLSRILDVLLESPAEKKRAT